MTTDECIEQAPLKKSGLNWYRGLYRLWAVISLFWLVLGTPVAGYMSWEQWRFTRNLAQTRANEAAEAKERAAGSDFILLIDKHTGKVCTETTADSAELFCSENPEGPWPAKDLGLVVAWSFVFAPVPVFYGLLRGGAWILGGFKSEPLPPAERY